MLQPKVVSNSSKQRKMKPLTPVPSSAILLQGENLRGVQEVKTPQRSLKRYIKNEASPMVTHPDRSTSDSSSSGNEYRSLRQKFLLLEEEKYAVEGELREVEHINKTMEDEKHALLDQLVVLEGLMDPSEIQPQVSPMV
ncbi:hypothetical protein GIB67_033768 [Kingdonia uniflora]|uniref:Uncharacterized protein n=1 Tax=Kingdonia uniflora TaxID=39325 RepID=A0A7J7P461_9MAGN|nr:hypothetical protein GIB67_033768 [Kingdonia uniflora]